MPNRDAHSLLILQCLATDLPAPSREYRFHESRRWRFDLAWPEYHIYAEIDGGVWVNGRHTRGAGYSRDCEKFNQAALLGWRGFHFTPDMVKSGEAVCVLEKAIRKK